MNHVNRLLSMLSDPRYYQIIVLSLLLGYGIIELDFGICWQNALIIVATTLAVQYLGTRYATLPRFDPLSPLITSMSLTLLLRTDAIWLAAIAALKATPHAISASTRSQSVSGRSVKRSNWPT